MLATAFVLSAWAISAICAREHTPDALATVVFAGGTGVPKSVMLSHASILANIDAVAQIFQLRQTDVMAGVLPFFPFLRLHRDLLAADGRGVRRCFTDPPVTPAELWDRLCRCELPRLWLPEHPCLLTTGMVGNRLVSTTLPVGY